MNSLCLLISFLPFLTCWGWQQPWRSPTSRPVGSQRGGRPSWELKALYDPSPYTTRGGDFYQDGYYGDYGYDNYGMNDRFGSRQSYGGRGYNSENYRNDNDWWENKSKGPSGSTKDHETMGPGQSKWDLSGQKARAASFWGNDQQRRSNDPFQRVGWTFAGLPKRIDR